MWSQREETQNCTSYCTRCNVRSPLSACALIQSTFYSNLIWSSLYSARSWSRRLTAGAENWTEGLRAEAESWAGGWGWRWDQVCTKLCVTLLARSCEMMVSQSSEACIAFGTRHAGRFTLLPAQNATIMSASSMDDSLW